MAMRSNFTRARAGGLALAVVLGVATFTARPLFRPTVSRNGSSKTRRSSSSLSGSCQSITISPSISSRPL